MIKCVMVVYLNVCVHFIHLADFVLIEALKLSPFVKKKQKQISALPPHAVVFILVFFKLYFIIFALPLF